MGEGNRGLSELGVTDHYINRWRRKLEELPFIRFAGAAQHIAGSQRALTTRRTLRSLRGTVERKAPSKQLGRREGAYVFA